MKPENKQKMLSPEYVGVFTKALDNIVLYDEADKALELSGILEKALDDNATLLQTRPDLINFYKDSLTKLKLICLPAQPDKEVLDLFKKNFILMLSWPDYDLLGKLKAKLINIDIVSERDKFKEDLKKITLENSEIITSSSPLKTIKDWLKDYLLKTGLDNQDSLKKAQYLSELKNIKTIKTAEYQVLSLLLNFYDRLNVSSETPAGFEEEYPVVKDGKLFIFSKGVLEPVPDVKANYGELTDLVSQPVAEKNLEVAPNQPEKPTPNISSPVVPSRLQELEQALKNYPPDSLESKAIKQEIEHFNKSVKKSPKLDVKK